MPLSFARRSAAALMFSALVAPAAPAQTLYWDINGTLAEAGGTSPSGAWDGTTANFNTDSTGGAGGTMTAVTTNSSAVVFSAGADATGAYTVTLAGPQVVNSLAVEDGTVSLVGGAGGVLTLGGAGPTIATGANTLTIRVALAGTGGFTRTGAGVGALTFDGDLSGLSGTINLAVAGSQTRLRVDPAGTVSGGQSATWNLSVGGAILVSENTTGVTNATISLGALQGVAGSTLRNGGNGTGVTTFSIGALDATTTFAGNITFLNSAAYTAVTKVGTGTLTLSGANTYGGTTTITAGAIRAGSATALSAATAVAFGASTTGRLQLGGFNLTIGGLSGSGTPVVENASGTDATLNLGYNSSGNTVTFAGVIQDGTGGGRLSLNRNGAAGTQALTGTQANTYTGTTAVTGAGVLLLGKSGTANAVTGDVTITNGGKLVFATGTNQIPDTATVTMSGAASVFNGTGTNAGQGLVAETIGGLIVTGGSVNGNNNGTTGAITVTGAASFTGGAGNTTVVLSSNSRTSFGGLSITNMAASAGVTVATTNSFTVYGNSTGGQSVLSVGALGLQLNGSTLNLRRGTSTASSLGSRVVLGGDVTTVAAAVTSRISEDTQAAANLAGNLALQLGSAGVVTRTFTVAAGTVPDGAADFRIAVPITNGAATTGNVVKAGDGVLELATTPNLGPLPQTNTYTGTTTVNAGTLLANTTLGSATGSGAVSVSAAGTLGGTGTVAGATAVSGAVRGGATGLATAAAATLTVGNTVTIGQNGTLRVEAADTAPVGGVTDSSRVALTGAGSVLNLNPGAGNRFLIDLVSNATTPLVQGTAYTFVLVTAPTPADPTAATPFQLNGTTILTDGVNPTVIGAGNYTLTSASFAAFSDVTLAVRASGDSLVLMATPVPEPATALGLAAGGLGLVNFVRRRRAAR